jgi:hypothetical protein
VKFFEKSCTPPKKGAILAGSADENCYGISPKVEFVGVQGFADRSVVAQVVEWFIKNIQPISVGV